MYSKFIRHRYICQKSPAYPRHVLIDTSIKIIYSNMDKQYINILYAPKPNMRLYNVRQSFKQQIEFIIYKLENTISTTIGNKLTLLDVANDKAICGMSKISQPFLFKILILQLCLRPSSPIRVGKILIHAMSNADCLKVDLKAP